VSAVEAVRRRAGGVFFGWWIVAGGMALQMLQLGLLQQAYGVYITALGAEFGWSKTAFSLASAAQRVESGILGPVQGWLVDRFGPRAVMRVGTVIFGLGFILFSRIESLPGFYATFLLMAVGSSIAGFMPIITTVAQWFERRRAMAIGIMQTGMGIGGLLVPLVAWSLAANGWRATAFASGVLIIVGGLPLCQLMRRRPEDYGELPDGARPERLEQAARPAGDAAVAVGARPAGTTVAERAEFTSREALRTAAFWYISVGHAASLLVVSALQVHLIVHLTGGLGYTVQRAASLFALMTAVTMLGQLSGGFLGDRVNVRGLLTACMLGHAVAIFVLAYARTLPVVVLAVTLHGVSWGVRGPLQHALRADYFGRGSFGTILGFSSLILMWGTIAGPVIPGVLADRYGSYQPGFTLLAVLAGAGSFCFALARRPRLPARMRGVVYSSFR
jgi:MFS family permease